MQYAWKRSGMHINFWWKRDHDEGLYVGVSIILKYILEK
jgi:hypothetical protein